MINRVKELRARAGINQSQLAELIGVSRQTIHSIETGKFVPSTLLALKLAKVLAVQVEEIFEMEAGE